MFDMSNISGGIRDQSRKLSEIALNFGRFLALPNFRWQAFQKLYVDYHPCVFLNGGRSPSWIFIEVKFEDISISGTSVFLYEPNFV